MRSGNRAVLIIFWAATLVAAFAVGRQTASPGAAPVAEGMGASLRAALAEGDELERLRRTTGLLDRLDPDNLPEARAVYDSLLTVVDECDLRPFVGAWARFDPVGALDHSIAWPYSIKRGIGVEAAMHAWALRDPFAARLAYDQIAPEYPKLREGAFFNLITGWAHSGEDGLESYLAGLTPMTQSRATGLVIGVLSRRGGADAIQPWSEEILRNASYDKNFKMAAFRRGARSIARWDPDRAAAWALEHTGKDYAGDAPRIVAEEWAERDGRAALQWLRGLPEGDERDEAVHRAFLAWENRDSVAAEEWLRSETLTAFHDPAVNAFARRIDSSAPVEALGWCERILGRERRLGCLKTAATQWYRQDAPAAEAWLQQSPLDEEARRAVRTPPPKRQRRPGAPPPGGDAL